MNERHSEMMNQINAGAGRPVTASGQLGAARLCHGGVVRGMRFGSKLAIILGLTLLVSIFMYGGWYKPQTADAAITFRTAHSANAASVNITTPASGDLILVFAYRDGSTTAPSLAAGYTSIATQAPGGSNNSARIGWKISNGTEANSGTWTNATEVVALIYRGTTSTPIGTVQPTSGNGTTITYPTMLLSVTDGSSWVAGVAGHRVATAGMDGSTAALTNRTFVTTANGLDTNGGVASFANQTLNVTTTGRWISWAIELLALDTTAPTVSAVAVQTGLTVDVTFSEAMGTGVTTASNYTVSGTGKGSLANNPNSVALVSGNTYRLTWSTGEMLNGGNITITVANAQDAAGNTIGSPNSGTHTGGAIGVAPTVTINQAAAQADPTGTEPINFTVIFSESVANFATGDVAIAGTAGGTKTATVTGSGTTYNVAVTGMTTAGTVIASINAGVATDTAGNPNVASTSTDNSVSWTVGPVCTRNAPTFSITPATRNVKTNQSVIYTLTIVNNDTAECADSTTFNISAPTETGDTADFTLPSVRSATSVSVAAGGVSNSTVTLTVTSAVAAVDGKALTSELTISDAVNHNLMDQTDSVVTTVANFNPMIHSSLSTGSTKWLAEGGWGVSGGQYGEFTCATCHVKGSTNIKRVLTPITATGSSRTVNFQDATAGADVAVDPADFGNDGDSRGTTPSERICEVCHTQTSYHRVTADATPSLAHFNKTDCISCHKHGNGFDASCTTCHPTYPEPPATNAHVTHAGSTGYAYACTICHPLDHDGTAADITFTGVAATWGTASYSGATDKQCGNLYCHGGATADWDGGTGGACGDCHGAASTGRPNAANEPSGGSHLTGSHQAAACTECHSHDGTDKTEHVNGPADASGDALVSSAGSSITTYTYGSTLASSPDPDGYKYSGGTCATSCHSDGVWGGSGGCTFCHGGSGLYYPQGALAPNRIAEHADHIYALETKLGYTHGTTDDAQQKVMCAYCHNDTNGIGGTGHNDGGVAEVGAFNPMWNGATADSNGALDAGKTCSNIDCHYSTTTADTWYGTGTATCTYCHAGDAAYAAGSLPGVHDSHVDEVADGGRDKTCVTCHGSSATYANDHANGSSGTEVAFSGSTTYTYNDTNNTCGSATNNGLGCHATGTPDWDVPFAITVCTNCHTNTTNTAVNPTSGLHATGPTVSGQAHNQTLGGSGCASCHTVAALTTHANGAFTGNGTTDRTPMGLPATAGNGYTATANDVGSCVGTWLTGCHTGAGDQGTWARKWDASIHYVSTGAECAGCHGGFANDWTFGGTANTTDGSVEHNRNWDSDANLSEVIGNHSNNTDKKCNTCHVYGDAAYVMGTHHRNGQITMNSTMGYQRTTTTPNYGCTNTCHSSNTNHGMENSNWTLGTLAGPSLSCTSCHTGSGSGAFKVGSASTHVIRGTRAGMNTFNSCNDCHPEHTGGVLVANNATVGISYTQGGRTGFRLGGTATTGTTEAEICWNCHDNTATYQTTAISEWGTNNRQAGSPTAVINNNYNLGSLNQTNWIGATWYSAQHASGTGVFAYKSGAVRSTHAANDAVSTAGVDTVAQIRCSYCHDVHNTAAGLVAGDVSGKPFLRGTWWSNPYPEDGAPRATGTTWTVRDWGAVPRGSNLNNELGGFQIDQNNNYPTNNGTAPTKSGSTWTWTNSWTYSGSAGLCALCHGSSVNTLNKFGTAGPNAAWIGTNGHANAAVSGTGTSAANIFRTSDRAPSGVNTQGAKPDMGYANHGTAVGYGFRGPDGRAFRDTPFMTAIQSGNSSRPYAGRYYSWGAVVDNTTIETKYHNFSCSKCHNPHASRLPRLMITNCLDTKQNTWDDGKILDVNNSNDFGVTLSATTAPDSFGRTWSNTTSAQNCHRVAGTNTAQSAGFGSGWNRVTPWTIGTGNPVNTVP